jgi:hypothetical protein
MKAKKTKGTTAKDRIAPVSNFKTRVLSNAWTFNVTEQQKFGNCWPECPRCNAKIVDGQRVFWYQPAEGLRCIAHVNCV